MAKASERRKPDGLGVSELVACVDGPRTGAWYFETAGSNSWTEQVRLARLDGSGGSTILGYVDSGKRVPHPYWKDDKVTGKALVWRPERG